MLELTDLSTSYPGFDFGPVSLDVGCEVLCVLGPSGSGKTTLLSLVAGIVAPDAGTVALDGVRLDGRPLERRGAGLVFQDGALFPHMTARENVAYATDDEGYVDELAARFEIRGVLDRKPSTLSGGERRRVALARTLAADPDVLLLDEPLSSLDAPIRNRLRDELRDLFDSLDVPVVYVTHDQRTATALGDRIAVLRDGTVEQVGSPSDVLERPKSRFVARFTGNDNLFDAEVTGRVGGCADGKDGCGSNGKGGSGSDVDGDLVRLRVDGLELRAHAPAATDAGAVTACIRPSRVRLREPDVGGPGGGGPDADALNAEAPDVGPRRGQNVLRGTARRWLNEGDGYRVAVELDGAPVSLTVAVPPHRFERLALSEGSAVDVLLPPEAIHLIRGGGGTGRG